MCYRFIMVISVIVLVLIIGVFVVDISQDGVNVIWDNFNYLLFEDIVKSVFVMVMSVGLCYEIVYDFVKLLVKIKKQDFDIQGLIFFKMFVMLQDSGFWVFEGNNKFNVSGYFIGFDKKCLSFIYLIVDMVFNLVFDLVISYFCFGDFSVKDLKFILFIDIEVVNVSFGDMIYKLIFVESVIVGCLDFVVNGKFSIFVEQISGKEILFVQVLVDSLDFDVKINGIVVRDLKEIVLFVFDYVDQKQFFKESQMKLKDLVGKVFLFFILFEENIRFNNIVVISVVGGGGVKFFGYYFKVDGLSNVMCIGVVMDVVDVIFDSVFVFVVYMVFLLQVFDIQFGILGMDFVVFGEDFMKVDFIDVIGDNEKVG